MEQFRPETPPFPVRHRRRRACRAPTPSDFVPLFIALFLLAIISYLAVNFSLPYPERPCPSSDEMNRCFARLPKNSSFLMAVCNDTHFKLLLVIEA